MHPLCPHELFVFDPSVLLGEWFVAILTRQMITTMLSQLLAALCRH